MRKILQSKFISEYGTLLVLLVLFAYYTVATWGVIHPVSAGAAGEVAENILKQNPNAKVMIVVDKGAESQAFAKVVKAELEQGKATVVKTVSGAPSDASDALRKLGEADERIDFVAATHASAENGVLRPKPGKEGDHSLPGLSKQHPSLAKAKVIVPDSYEWSNFLTRTNVLKIANHISYTAIIAIGMTMVIITTGIDLSVGSLIALSGVIVACSARELGINPDSGLLILLGCVLLGIVGCGLLGTFSGLMVTAFGIHPFIVTLSIMSIARGLSFIIADGPSDVVIETESYRFLGAGRSLMGIPNSVILMMLLYVLAHLLMTRTVLGRHIYAVGGNREAAHLSGVPVKRVLIVVYTICGALAGLGGVVNSSLHGAGSAKSGLGYELQIIAAVVVGGTSLAGGSGNIMGTLVGALILGVIANGMNLTGVTTYPQMVVFGLLILVAVLIDQLKNRKAGAASS